MKNVLIKPFVVSFQAHSALALAAIVALLLPRYCQSQSAITWSGASGTSGNWNDSANWGGSAPFTQGYLNFDGSARTSNTNNFTAGSGGFQIYFKSTAGTFNLYGNSLNFFDYSSVDPNIQNEGAANTQIINFPITNANTHVSGSYRLLNINANASPAQGPLVFNGMISAPADNNARVINISGGSLVTFNGVISDGGSSSAQGVTQLGSGTTILSADNTFNGQLSVNAGAVQIGNGAASGSISNASSINNNSVLVFNRTGVAGYGNVMTGTGSLTARGGGTNILTGVNTYSGQTILNGGWIQIGNGGATGTAGSGLISNYVAGGSSGLIFNRSDTGLTVTNQIWATASSSPTVYQNGSGSATLGGAADNISVGAIVNNGTLNLGKSSSASVHALGGNTTINNRATLKITGIGGDQIYDGINVTLTSGTFDLGGTTETIAALTTPTTSVNVTNIVKNGTLTVTNSSSVSASTNTVLDMSILDGFAFRSPTLSFLVQPQTTSGTVTNELYLSKSGTNFINASSVTAGAASGTSQGVDHMGKMHLGTSNTIYTSTLSIGGFNGRGVMDFQSGLGASPSLVLRNTSGGSSRVTLVKVGETSSGVRPGDGVLDLTGINFDALVQDFQLGRMTAGANINDTSTVNMSSGTLDTITLTIAEKGNIGTSTLTSTFNQSGGFVKAMTLTLGQATNSSTATAVLKPTYNLNGGALAVSNILAGIGTNSASSVRLLNFNAGIISNYDAATDLFMNGVLVGGGTNFSIALAATNTHTFFSGSGRIITITNAPVTGGSLNKDGAGSLVLASTNTFSGGITNLAGDIVLANSGAVNSANVLTFDNNANTKSFSLNGNNTTLAGLLTSATVGTTTVRNNHASTAATLTVNNSANNTYAGVFQNGGAAGLGITKSGSGMLTLTGNGSLLGADVTVAGGTLFIDPGLSGGFTNTTRPLVGSAASTAATMIINSGTAMFSGGGIFGVGDGSGTTVGTINVSNAAINVMGALRVLVGNKTTGILNISGGTMLLGTTTGDLVVGGDQSFSSANAAGFINLNSGSFSITNSGNFILGRTNGATTGVSGTVNLNGGTLTTARGIWHLDGSSSGTNNFNGGTLKAATAISVLLSNVTANVRNGGAIIDDGGFAITIPQSLAHSVIGGDSAVDGGLTKLGGGTLTLGAGNTYTGPTVINAGTLALSGVGSIAASPSITIAGTAKFDVSGLTTPFSLGSGQTLSNSAAGAVIRGTNNTSSGIISLLYDGANPSFIITNGVLTLSSSTSIKATKSGTALLPGTHKIIGAAAGASPGQIAGTAPGSVTVVNGPGAGTPALAILNGELYLTVGGASTWSYPGDNGPFTYNGVAQTPPISFNGSTGLKTTNYIGTGATVYNSANAPTNAGTYYVSNTVAADANYLGAVSSQSFTINKATPLTATLPVVSAITYGQTVAAASVTSVSFTNSLGAAVAMSSTNFVNPAILPYAGTTNVLLFFTASDTGNYNNVTNTVSVTVNQAALIITANSTNKIYDGIPFSGGNGVTYAGFVNGETNTVLTGTLAYGGSSQGATNAGSYSIAPSGVANTNYLITFVNGTLTISKASTSVGVSSTMNPSGYKDVVSFTATLPTDATGSVVFSSTNGAFSTNTVSSGSATSLNIINLPRGTNLITVAYLGDSNYYGSTNTLNQIVTNHPPTAANASYSRGTASVWHMAASQVLTNATDADGDILTLNSVGTSTNGVNVQIISGQVYYNNTNVVNDQFNYMVVDGYGGTNSGVITLTVSNAVSGTSSIAGVITGNPTTLTAYGIPGYTYITERATNLDQVMWDEIATNIGPAISVTDSNPPPGQAYYRLKWKP